MAKNKIIQVKGHDIPILQVHNSDYISLTDMLAPILKNLKPFE